MILLCCSAEEVVRLHVELYPVDCVVFKIEMDRNPTDVEFSKTIDLTAKPDEEM